MTNKLENEHLRDDSWLSEFLRLADQESIEPPEFLTEQVRTKLVERTATVMPSRGFRLPAAGRTPRSFVRYGMIATALGILVVIGLGLQPGKHLLADVADAIAKHRTVQFTTVGNNSQQATGYWTLDSQHFRYFIAGVQRTVDYKAGKILILNPAEKTGRLILFDPQHAGEPRLELLRVIRDEGDAKPAREKLDGRDVLVYRLSSEKNYPNEKYHVARQTVVWADPSTLLPVRIEQVTRIQKGEAHPTENKHVMQDFVWDPAEINNVETFFSVTPPDGYDIEFVDADKQKGDETEESSLSDE